MNAQEMRKLATESKPKLITGAIEILEEHIKKEASKGAMSTVVPVYLYDNSGPMGFLKESGNAKTVQEHLVSKGFDVHLTRDSNSYVDFIHIVWGLEDG